MKEPQVLSSKPTTVFFAFAILGGAAFQCDIALARDSSRYVCSGVADLGGDGEKLGISMDFFDSRAAGGAARKYVLSSIYQGKLFQDAIIDRSDNFGQGKVTLKSGRSRFYSGSFKLEQQQGGDGYVMSIEGKITNDPTGGGKLYPVKAKLPCVDLSV
jgi:hypothetical protein